MAEQTFAAAFERACKLVGASPGEVAVVEGERRMTMPNAHLAVVERGKVTEYLLNPAHPDNGGKAQFFIALGFRPEDWEALAAALRRMALNSHVAQPMETVHGKKYIVDGPIDTPAGKAPVVRTVWIIDKGFDAPRLVTAYPHGVSDDD